MQYGQQGVDPSQQQYFAGGAQGQPNAYGDYYNQQYYNFYYGQ